MNINHFNIESLQELFAISESDLKHIRIYSKIVLPKMEQWNTEFYNWLKTQPEFNLFFSSDHTLQRVQKMQHQYWQLFFEAELNDTFLNNRYKVGVTHAHLGLPLEIYLAAANKSQDIFLTTLYDDSLDAETYLHCCKAFAKLLFLDIAIATETISKINNQIITDQTRVITEMSTPVSEIWEDTLLLPLVGVIDSQRSHNLMNMMLERISTTQAKIFIIDIRGVTVVDTAVANHLIKMVKASQLMGCTCLISGLSPAIAQTIVELGIDTQGLTTTATLKDALRISFKLLKDQQH